MLLASVLGNGDLHELQKIPALIHHYQEHLSRAGGQEKLSFIDFLEMHYANTDHEQSEDHDQLPLKHSHACGMQVMSLIPQVKVDWVQPISVVILPLYQTIFQSSFLACIWQPPQ
jgi:hypothetical protein